MTVNAFPAALQAIIQNGILDRTFLESLLPKLLFRQVATSRPFAGNIGELTTFTRTGLLAPVTTALVPGVDPDAVAYSVEQYSMGLAQYGSTMDTNLLTSAIAIANKFLEDNQKLAIQAGQSLNQICRNKLYGAYGFGNGYTVGTGTGITALVVNDASKFATVLVNGVQTAVSVANPLPISINDGSVVNVTAVVVATNTLTLDAVATWTDGMPVVAVTGAKIFRPGAKASAKALVAGDVATLSIFMDAVAALRQQNVPDFGGYYSCHLDAITERQLFGDPDFKQALQGRVDSPMWGSLSLGRFAGIDWVRNTEVPIEAGTGDVVVRKPILVGADCLIEGPLQNFGNLLDQTNGQNAAGHISMVNGVAFIHRAPQDKLQQIVSSTWSWVGDYAIPSDSLVGSPAKFKRAAIIEHAS